MKRTALILATLGVFVFVQAAQADWTPAKRITWTAAPSDSPVIATDLDNTLHVVWSEYLSGNAEICYKKSSDGGVNWNAAKRLSWTSGPSFYPVLAIDLDKTIHVVWEDRTPGIAEIYYRRSEDGGATWAAVKRLTWTSDGSYEPDIAVDPNGTIHVVWYDDTPGNSEIFYKTSGDGGVTWSAVKRLTWTSSWSGGPAIAARPVGSVHVVWYDSAPGNYELYYKTSGDGGTTWSAAKRLTWTPGYTCRPAIAIDSNARIHVVWFDEAPGNFEIYYKSSSDGGSVWSPARRLTWTSGGSQGPDLAIDSSNAVHVAWDDDTPDHHEIYYKRSTDGGAAWTSVTRLTWTSGDSMYPSMAVDDGDCIHIVWHDYTTGNCDIYYKKSI